MVRNKLRGNTGASLSLALLLFLICSVLGTVVLTAATAAAGRASEMAESDQRYYSVVSAAELLAEQLCGEEHKVTLTRTRVVTETTVTPYTAVTSPEGDTTRTPGSPTETYTAKYTTRIGSAEILENTYDTRAAEEASGGQAPNPGSFLSARAADLLFRGGKCNTPAAMSRTFTAASTGSPGEGTFSVKASGTGVAVPDLAGTYALRGDGTLVITLTAAADSGGYTLTLTLVPHFKESESSNQTGGDAPEVSEPTTVTNPDGYPDGTVQSTYEETLETVTTYTRTSTVYWTVGSIA